MNSIVVAAEESGLEALPDDGTESVRDHLGVDTQPSTGISNLQLIHHIESNDSMNFTTYLPEPNRCRSTSSPILCA